MHIPATFADLRALTSRINAGLDAIEANPQGDPHIALCELAPILASAELLHFRIQQVRQHYVGCSLVAARKGVAQ